MARRASTGDGVMTNLDKVAAGLRDANEEIYRLRSDFKEAIRQRNEARAQIAAKPKHEADWSGLPKDIYVTACWKMDDIFWAGEFAQVPMAIGPEVRYTRVDGGNGNELDEAWAQIAAKDAALRQIADAPAWGAPDKWETTPAEVRQLARAALSHPAQPSEQPVATDREVALIWDALVADGWKPPATPGQAITDTVKRLASPPAQPTNAALVAAVHFLIDRLDEYENEIADTGDYTMWFGHAAPALGRVRSLIAATPAQETE